MRVETEQILDIFTGNVNCKNVNTTRNGTILQRRGTMLLCRTNENIVIPHNVIITSRRVIIYYYNITRLRRACAREKNAFPCSSRVHRRRCTFDWPSPIHYTHGACPAPATPMGRRRTFIIYYSRRTVRKRQVLVCCLYNQLARCICVGILYYIPTYLPTYLLLGYISVMHAKK
jgi:hypothetical protein